MRITNTMLRITTEKIGTMGYMASSVRCHQGVHGFGPTRSAAIADLRRQMRHPV